MQQLWDFLANNKDAVDTLLKVFTFIGLSSVAGVIGWFINRWWKQRVRIDVDVFEVITDPAVLLPKLYGTENDDSLLADHRITYQPRDPDRDIQAELKTALNRARYLLITAPTGYGKTREAGTLAQTMMLEGWRVLRIKTGWLDTPKTLPEELNNNRSRVLLLLDDLNGLFSTGERTQSPRAEQIPMLSQTSYHDRLLQVLDMLEGMCTAREIRVVATARSEPDQWSLLNYDEKDKLWKRFERVELHEPNNKTIISLLGETTKQANIKANAEEFEAIARKSDGTYRNILLNLRRWKAQNREVDIEDFTDTLNGSWHDIYQQTLESHPAVEYIYEAIDVLRQTKIDLFPFLVESTTKMVWNGNTFQIFIRQRKIRQTIHYLIETNILRMANGKFALSDGQIEARGKKVSATPHLEQLTPILLQSTNKHLLSPSYFGLATFCYFQEKFEQSYQLIKRYIELNPDHAKAYSNLGVFLDNLKRYEEAETAYRKAIELNPDHATAYYNLGSLLDDLERYEEAEAAYRKTIEFNPDHANAYYNLGNLLDDLERYEEAEAAYRKAIELNPDHATTYSNLGNLLKNLERYEEAKAAYRKAIDLNPSLAEAYYNLGLLLHEKLKCYEDAEAAYRKAIELNPDHTNAYSNFGNLLQLQEVFTEALANYRKALELKEDDAIARMSIFGLLKKMGRTEEAKEHEALARELIQKENDYNRACFESLCGNMDEALALLKIAFEKGHSSKEWAKQDPDLENLRDDERFKALVGE